jgi:hypothetical protein
VNGRPGHRIGCSRGQGCSNDERKPVRKGELESLHKITAFTSIRKVRRSNRATVILPRTGMIRLLCAARNSVFDDNSSGSRLIATAFSTGKSNLHSSRGHGPHGLANRLATRWALPPVLESCLDAFQMKLMATNVQANNGVSRVCQGFKTNRTITYRNSLRNTTDGVICCQCFWSNVVDMVSTRRGLVNLRLIARTKSQSAVRGGGGKWNWESGRSHPSLAAARMVA